MIFLVNVKFLANFRVDPKNFFARKATYVFINGSEIRNFRVI
jgi:hypothetical protein